MNCRIANMNIFPRDTGLGVCTEGVLRKFLLQGKIINFTFTRWKWLWNCGWKYTICWNHHLHYFSIIKGTSVLADKEDSHKIKIPDDLLYYYKSPGVPQIILVLCEWSFSLHLNSRFALTQSAKRVEDMCMMNYCVKNVCRYRYSKSPIDFLYASVLA